MSRKSEMLHTAGTIAKLAFVTVMAVGLSVAGAMVSITDAYPQERAQQPMCGTLKSVREGLNKQFKEVEMGGGFINESAAVLLFATPDGASWTLVTITPNGGACILAGGQGWFQAEILKGQPA
jgi:hypothetical protein